MSELGNHPDVDQQATDIVTGWFDAGQDTGEDRSDYGAGVLAPAIERDATLGMAILERLAESDDRDARAAAAVFMAHLPADTPKDQYLGLAQRLLEDRNNRVFHQMWWTLCLEPIQIELAWTDVRQLIDDAARGDLERHRPDGSELPPYQPLT